MSREHPSVTASYDALANELYRSVLAAVESDGNNKEKTHKVLLAVGSLMQGACGEMARRMLSGATETAQRESGLRIVLAHDPPDDAVL